MQKSYLLYYRPFLESRKNDPKIFIPSKATSERLFYNFKAFTITLYIVVRQAKFYRVKNQLPGRLAGGVMSFLACGVVSQAQETGVKFCWVLESPM